MQCISCGDLPKAVSEIKKHMEKGWYGFTIEKVSVPQMKLDGYMKDRNEWHKEWM